MQVEVSEELAVPAERLWALFEDFGDVSWAAGAKAQVVGGPGPGMVRIIGGSIHERLEAVDPAERRLEYSISEGLPLPVRDYRACVRVEAVDAATSRLRWSCSAEPDGVDEDQARQQVAAMYRTMIGWVAKHLGAA